jgi:hypothetical protein
MSKTVALFPIVSALVKGLEMGKANGPFCPVNTRDEKGELQETFLSKFFSQGVEALGKFSPEELRTIASKSASEINQWLSDNGFDISLDEFTDLDDFGTASIMDVTVKWQTEGEEKPLFRSHHEGDASGTVYIPGAFIDTDVIVTTVKNHPHPVARINCVNGDKFYITLVDRPRDRFDLIQHLTEIMNPEQRLSAEFRAVHYPMVDLNQEVDIDFFKGMAFSGVGRESERSGSYKIKQAKQQTIFKLNHVGARAKSAAAFAFAFECCVMVPEKEPLVIDGPFFAWITREGLPYPYFAGYVTEEDFKRPVGLGDEETNTTASSNNEKVESVSNFDMPDNAEVYFTGETLE